MRKLTEEEIKKDLELHSLWINCDPGGVRLNWSNCLIQDANLDGASLNGASLVRASLNGASLVRARLNGASLVRARLVRASLDGASLNGASLNGASLDGASLDGANLDGANLNGANLNGANLDGANLDGANLDGASLDGANLVRASLDKKIYQASGVGSVGRFTVFNSTDNVVMCGCFNGTLEEFEAKIKDTHKDNPKHLGQYLAMVEYFKKIERVRIMFLSNKNGFIRADESEFNFEEVEE